MDSMNEVCRNASALPPWRDPALWAVGDRDHQEATTTTTTQKPTEIAGERAVFGTVSTDTDSLHDTAGVVVSTSAGKFSNSTNADTDFYLADDGGSTAAMTSFDEAFTDRTSTSEPVTSATGTGEKFYDKLFTGRHYSAIANFAYTLGEMTSQNLSMVMIRSPFRGYNMT